MLEILTRLSAADLAIVLVVTTSVLGAGLITLASQIISAVRRYREREIASLVIIEMLHRGVAPQEIIGVLNAMGLETSSHGRAGNRFRQMLNARRFAQELRRAPADHEEPRQDIP